MPEAAAPKSSVPPAAAKPAAAPPPSIAPPAEKAIEEISDAGSELDAMSEEEALPREQRKGAKPAAEKPAAVEPPEDAAPGDKPEDKETKPEEEKIPVRAAELRVAYQNLKKKVREQLEPEVTKLQARIKQLESQKPEDLSPLQDRLTAAEKRNSELESEIQYVNYSKSKEFQEKYADPYLKAWQKAMKEMDELTVELDDGTIRKATDHDLIMLSNLPLGEARKRANSMFGDAADDVMAHRRSIRELSDAQNQALDNARKTAGDRLKTNELAVKARTAETQKLWVQANTDEESKNPKWNERIKGDEELRKAQSEGFAIVDRMFSPTEETRPKNPQEAVKLHAEIRNIVGNYKPLLALLKRTRAELKDAKESLAEYDKSDPSSGRVAGPQRQQASEDNWESELAKLDKPGL